MYDGTTPPLRRHHHRKQGRWRLPGPGPVRRSRRALGISQSCQHRERAHGEPDRYHRHGPGRTSARGVAVALAVVSDALKHPVASSTR
jgi:hypothetical protein